jgi:hypothetical protein
MTTETLPQREQTDDGLPEPVDVPKGGVRHQMRTRAGVRHVYRLTVFLVGLMFIAGGIALAVLPGPLTIPPVLLGLWIWSTEFAFAERFFDQFKEKAHEAWAAAKQKPVFSAIVTVGGLIMAGVAFWAVGHYELVDKAKDFVA